MSGLFSDLYSWWLLVGAAIGAAASRAVSSVRKRRVERRDRRCFDPTCHRYGQRHGPSHYHDVGAP